MEALKLLCLYLGVVVAAASAGHGSHLRERHADFRADKKSLLTRQDANCGSITVQLDLILEPCATSLSACLEAAQPATLAVFLCNEEEGLLPWRELVMCRGRDFADQVWTTTCSEVDGVKCYELMQNSSNQQLVDGTFSECCGTPTCSESCQVRFQEMLDTFNCCVNTAPFDLLFESCSLVPEGGGGSITPGLEAAFSACDVEFPEYCEHLFSNVTVDDGSGRISSSLVSVLAMLVLLVFTVMY